MGSDSTSNDVVYGKVIGRKKKKTNRLAKLKQSKLDVRREQWLSQVKSKGCNADSKGTHEENRSSWGIVSRFKGVDLMISPGDSCIVQRNLIEGLPTTSCNSSNSSRCCSGSVSEAEEDDDCLDDWEAVADALTANENHPNLTAGSETKTMLDDRELTKKNHGVGLVITESKEVVSGVGANSRAWCPDDAFRPRSLPDLLKQHSANMNKCIGSITWACQNTVSQPSSCPICYEDLDLTDSSFLPCPCGFCLCLFCHQKILEADGRCPGCRKHYNSIKGDVGFDGGAASLQRGQSLGMSIRS